MIPRQELGKKHYAHCCVFPTDTLKVKEKKKKKKDQVSLGWRLLGSSLLQPERTCRRGCFAEFFPAV